MRKYNKKANYDSKFNYLNFLDATRKFFTNDQDIIPIISEFNFYINGVYSTPFTDLFRMYDDNLEDIHGAEKTKQFIDDGTIGIINEAIYKVGNGSLLTAFENTRVILENKKPIYNVGFNPMSLKYTEAIKPVIIELPDGNPLVNGEDENRRAIDPLPDNVGPDRTIPALPLIPKKKKKSFWQYLDFMTYKNSARYKRQLAKINTSGRRPGDI